ncbi:MAG: sigma-54 dependent transcriptional regulator [Holosporales bacterium]|jgi:two-component system nitrogen regulation response regulator NtrX|nr:sigma-54 dependent transcriptional regulator [Holosporales bacterium]
MAFNILIVDDEEDIRGLVSGILNDHDYETETAEGYVTAVESIHRRRPHLAIIDVWLGDNDRDGLRILELIKKEYEYVPVIMMSGHGTIETAVSAIKHGAHDFIEKPFDSHRLITSVEKAIEVTKLQMENADLRIKAKYSGAILGESTNSNYIRQTVERIGPLSGRCVIMGPYGSDKEIVAREIHRLSNRAKSPFGVLNCRSLLENHLETELFGTEIVISDNIQIKHGLLERVNGGTLFIDELVSSSPDFQMKFLRTIKDEAFARIGSHKKLKLNIRVIAGFPPDIEQIIKDGEFSNELFYRLNANSIKITPLNARREDIPILLNHFMEQSAKSHNTVPKRFSSEAKGILNTYAWPGDVMQLRNLVDWVLTNSISAQCDDLLITIDDLPREIMGTKSNGSAEIPFISSVSEMSIRDARETFEREYFIEQLKKFSGNISQTSKFVGMERSALHRKLKALNITDPKLLCDETAE